MKTLTLLIFSQIFLCMIDLWGSAVKARPNILWLVVEDQSKHYGFNGEKLVHTPVLDELAANGVRFGRWACDRRSVGQSMILPMEWYPRLPPGFAS